MSDLRAHADLRLGFSNEFLQRADGWPGLRDRYSLPQADVRKSEMPDFGSYKLGQGSSGDPSRFSPHVVLDDRQPVGRSPRTFADKQDTVDLGGAYSVTRNFDVTAGVRYSQQRDRLRPLNDGKQDSQAVYVGTQFRF